MEYVARSAPDGYTILIGTDAVSSNPHVYKLAFDPSQALVPVIELSRQPIALAAHPSLGVASIAELTAKAKRQMGMRFATGSGVGSLQAMVALWYAKLAGISLEQVPYRGGGAAINDLIAGHVQLRLAWHDPANSALQGWRHLSTCAIDDHTFAGTERCPDVSGGGHEKTGRRSTDRGICNAGTPPEIAARLNAAINAALADDKVRNSFADQAQEAAGAQPNNTRARCAKITINMHV